MTLTLTPQAQNIYDKVQKGNHPNNEDLWTRGERDYIESISCSDGFWYGITDGGYINPKDIVEEAKTRELTQSELRELEDIWSKISIEF